MLVVNLQEYVPPRYKKKLVELYTYECHKLFTEKLDSININKVIRNIAEPEFGKHVIYLVFTN